MKFELAAGLQAGSMREQAQGASSTWPLSAALVLSAIFWLLAWYWDTVHTLVAIWERSETFAHGYLIVPISAWLVWRRRHTIVKVNPRPNFLVLPLLALVGFGWLLGQLAAAGVVQQYALVLMIPLLVWTILGNQIVRALAFPLFFLLFAVPFGEFLLPLLMEQTADVLILSLRLTGIPVYREGQFFTIPSGSWSVVEACSGLRYLIASLTLGFLYAYLTYRSFARRAIFVVASVVVPIVANWLRAYMVVMIGHLSGMKYAVGIDHLIYGWIFFGVVMLILFGIGSLWREDLAPLPVAPSFSMPTRREESFLKSIMAATIAVAMIVVIWPMTAARLEGPGPYPAPLLQEPSSTVSWQPIAERLTDWAPHFLKPQAKINRVYAGDGGRVGLYIGYYRNQRQGVQLISSQNVLLSGRESAWGKIGEVRRTLILDDGRIPLVEAQLRGPSTRLLVWRWYWVDGRYVVNPYWAKFLQARSKLFGFGDDGAVIIAYTDFDMSQESASRRLREFVDAMLPGITSSLQRAR